MNTELVVCWDGAHEGVDADLLFAQRLPVKIQPPPLATAALPCLELVTHALRIHRAGLTTSQLTQVTGLSEYQTRQVISRLRREGAIETFRLERQERQGWRGVGVAAYRLLVTA